MTIDPDDWAGDEVCGMRFPLGAGLRVASAIQQGAVREWVVVSLLECQVRSSQRNLSDKCVKSLETVSIVCLLVRTIMLLTFVYMFLEPPNISVSYE